MAQTPNKLSAIHIGINSYPAGNALEKCVADAKGLAELFGGKLLLDKKVTRKALIPAVQAAAKNAGEGVSFVGSYSGHGSQAKDRNNDEPDSMDETIVMADLDDLVDDEFPGMVAGRRKSTKGLFIFDSCFSGNMQKSFSVGRNLAQAPKQIVRYMSPANVRPKRHRKVSNAGNQSALRNMVVMSACTDFEFAYEGEEYGVWTGALIETYATDLTIGEWFKAACAVVADGPFGMVQHPQISCSRAALKWPVPVR